MAPNSANRDFEFSFRTRQSAWTSLQSNPTHLHNVIIVGGGIVGAGVARQLASSGVQDVVLIERGDFASGTSSVSSKLIHAGIRYLEQSWIYLKQFKWAAAVRNFIFVVQASHERKVLGRMAPGLVKPKIIYLVLARGDQRSILSVWLGVWTYYAIQIAQGQFFSIPRLFHCASSISKRFSDLNPNEVRAVFSFWDSETDDARLVIENLQAASRAGVKILNYAELLSYKQEDGFVQVEVRDRESTDKISIRSKLVINAGGPWVDAIKGLGGESTSKKLVDRVAGGHLDVYPAITPHSFYITASDGRLVFVLRREEDGLSYSRIGTTERPLKENESSDAIRPSPDEINYLKGVVRQYFPRAALDSSNLLHLDEGIRPLRAQTEANVFNKSRDHDFVQERRVVHVVGVKLTDFRRASGELIESIDWAKMGIAIESLASVRAPLRSKTNRYYLEEGMVDVVFQTMILHWDDYVERRRGRLPAFHKRFQPEMLEKELTEIGRHMGWDSARIEAERSRSKPL